MKIVLVGVNHRSAPLELRERVAFVAEEARRAADELRSARGFREAMVLSTCNRSEVYAVPGPRQGDPDAALETFLADFHGLERAEFAACLYRHRDTNSAQHLFRVAAGLDSLLLGEAEILGQVRDAYMAALKAGSTGPVLNRLFQGALEVGKRVRSETDLGTRPMSAAFAAVKLAEQIFGDLKQHRALILGAGTVGEQVVEHLRNRGVERISVANRSQPRAEELARRMRGAVQDWASLERGLAAHDIVVSSVSSAERIVGRDAVERAMHERKGRGLFLIDLGVPRNIDPAAGELYNVYLYNQENLAEIVEQNRRAREEEIPRAEAIVAEHVGKFEAWQAGVLTRALFEELRQKLQNEREAFLEEHREQIRQLSAEDRLRFGALAEELLDRIVNEPGIHLRHRHDLRPKPQEVEAVREFFGLARE